MTQPRGPGAGSRRRPGGGDARGQPTIAGSRHAAWRTSSLWPPVGLAAWLIDHDTRSYALIARVFDGQTEGLTRDDLLDNITLYWLTSTAVSSARIYWENN